MDCRLNWARLVAVAGWIEDRISLDQEWNTVGVMENAWECFTEPQTVVAVKTKR